ncbi:glutathione peroxidase [Paenibacillus radicis (ex Gao et al. 2016)]|uniref:Glutathione peroxidase n=1 Tax=Paenibacillus radicis (ex Gao et al. 2016) TaxID=1737354 RepID=A0A917M321_9BACL|nr:glutathione peroxidase [Paenibacillus radicis (ex Gao et al. 2016)]GGG74134.1 glutathione peroxidase [Paenibacillus radicis (ex Gao et al. 2016)]
MSIYQFEAEKITGEKVSLEQYKGKALVIVNTASKCGFTPQYSDLQKVYEEYKDQGLEILGFPSNQFGEQEPGSNSDVQSFCQINYGVSFPLFAKTDVRGEEAHPLFDYLTEQAPFEGFDTSAPSGKMLNSFLEEKLPSFLEGDSIKWNFTKFLIDREGHVVKRFESTEEPLDMKADIEKLL